MKFFLNNKLKFHLILTIIKIVMLLFLFSIIMGNIHFFFKLMFLKDKPIESDCAFFLSQYINWVLFFPCNSLVLIAIIAYLKQKREFNETLLWDYGILLFLFLVPFIFIATANNLIILYVGMEGICFALFFILSYSSSTFELKKELYDYITAQGIFSALFIRAYFRLSKILKVYFFNDLQDFGIIIDFKNFYIFEIGHMKYLPNELLIIFENYQIILVVIFIKLVLVVYFFVLINFICFIFVYNQIF